MSCEHYQRQIGDALASGDTALSKELLAHMRECAACREFHDAQKRLVAAMDAGVRAMVNLEIPSSLLPGVRARMELEQMKPSPFPWKIAAVAAVGILVLTVSPLLRNGPRVKDMSPEIVANTRPDPEMVVGRIPPAPLKSTPSVPPSRNAKRTAVHVTRQMEAGAPELEVLIDPAEARGLRQLATAVVIDPQWALAMTRPGEEAAARDEVIRPLAIPDLEIMPLDGVAR